MYTIKRAAELTGVPAATLRAWERRYGLVTPERTEAGYRLYDESALQLVREMAALVADGHTPSNAAREVSRREDEGGTPPPFAPATTSPDAEPTGPAAVDTTATERLVAAAAAMDPAEATRVLDERFALGSYESVVDDWLMPALEEVGLAWADGRISVAGEHLVAHAVLRRLAAAYEAAASPAAGPSVVIGLPAGARHELGIFAFAVALRRRGVRTLYLGPDLPTPAWSAALDAHSPRAAVLSVPREDDAAAAREVVDTLHQAHSRAALYVGGRQQDDVAAPFAIRLGHSIARGAAQVASALA